MVRIKRIIMVNDSINASKPYHTPYKAKKNNLQTEILSMCVCVFREHRQKGD